MQPHPDFATTDIPRQAALGDFRLTPLGPDAVDEDFAVVTESATLLTGLFGDDWPQGLTLADNAIDLAWHEREFTARRSFAWIVRDAGGTYLGCAYVYPDLGTRGQGRIVTWVRDRPDRDDVLAAINLAFAEWVSGFLPPGAAYDWRS